MTKLLEQARYMFQDFDKSNTFATAGSDAWLDVSEYHRITCIFFKTVGTGKIAAILEGSASAGGTSPVSISSSTSTVGTGLLNLAGPSSAVTANVSRIVFDITHDDLVKAGENLRYVSLKGLTATGTDECGILWILSEPRYGAATASTQATGGAL